MKSKDFFKKLKSDGKINQTEYDAFIEVVPEFEVPDKAVEAFESSFLTLDRAKVHPDINAQLRAELLDPVDVNIKKLLEHDLKDYFDHTKVNELKGEKSTYKKMEMLGPALLDVIKKVKVAPAADEDTKKKLKEKEDAIQDLMGKIETINSEYQSKEKTIKSDFEKQIHDYKLNGELEKLSNTFKFAKQFQDDAIRKDLTKVKLDKLRSENSLSLVEKDGQYSIQVMDKEGKPKFNGNSAVTINQLLEDSLKPFLKANNVDDDEGGKGNYQESQRSKVENQNPNFRQGARTTVQ